MPSNEIQLNLPFQALGIYSYGLRPLLAIPVLLLSLSSLRKLLNTRIIIFVLSLFPSFGFLLSGESLTARELLFVVGDLTCILLSTLALVHAGLPTILSFRHRLASQIDLVMLCFIAFVMLNVAYCIWGLDTSYSANNGLGFRGFAFATPLDFSFAIGLASLYSFARFRNLFAQALLIPIQLTALLGTEERTFTVSVVCAYIIAFLFRLFHSRPVHLAPLFLFITISYIAVGTFFVAIPYLESASVSFSLRSMLNIIYLRALFDGHLFGFFAGFMPGGLDSPAASPLYASSGRLFSSYVDHLKNFSQLPASNELFERATEAYSFQSVVTHNFWVSFIFMYGLLSFVILVSLLRPLRTTASVLYCLNSVHVLPSFYSLTCIYILLNSVSHPVLALPLLVYSSTSLVSYFDEARRLRNSVP